MPYMTTDPSSPAFAVQKVWAASKKDDSWCGTKVEIHLNDGSLLECVKGTSFCSRMNQLITLTCFPHLSIK